MDQKIAFKKGDTVTFAKESCKRWRQENDWYLNYNYKIDGTESFIVTSISSKMVIAQSVRFGFECRLYYTDWQHAVPKTKEDIIIEKIHELDERFIKQKETKDAARI